MSGDSSSSSDNIQTTEQQDNRIAAAQDSVNLVASRSTIGNITVTDAGAVRKSLEFGSDALDRSYDFSEAIAQGAASNMAASSANIAAVSRSAMDAVSSAYDDFSDKVAGAYTEAKAGEQKILVGGALLIGAVVAINALRGN